MLISKPGKFWKQPPTRPPRHPSFKSREVALKQLQADKAAREYEMELMKERQEQKDDAKNKIIEKKKKLVIFIFFNFFLFYFFDFFF